MRTVKITNNKGMFGASQQDEFDKFGLKVGDEIQVRSFVTNAAFYQKEPQGEVLFIYEWNIKNIN